ncbi:beta-glucosidase [Micromonospora pattaloongensis]|uniref:Exo-alpha-(1->6)-L-arabinopyranosidase n=1 Tax=Micromonospora pattaloongensis TaxID=405436 RepID=A0A1H3RSX6_9ACTN|nr:glycoside hydrolase family 3 protein [Micromonospora pattaloongensis]SDZ28792.1 beta-glucosidase [Micromonospora pattaloongensis]
MSAPTSPSLLPRHARRRRARRALLATLVLVAGLLVPAGPAAATGELPFRDPDLPLRARVDDLLGRLTPDEKISLLHQYQPAIPRLGVAAFKTGTEALHGVAWLGEATVFPQAIGLATTWDPELIRQVGDATGREARGFHRRDPAFNGLNLWAPVVNLLRDPRWGRNEEGYSEDPYLTGAISTAYGRGLQGNHPVYLQTAPTLKHYLANNNEVRRDTTSSMLPPRLLHDYEYPAFRTAIAANAATGVMTSYNLLNGRPATVEPSVDAQVRRWTERDLMVVSDAHAPVNLVESQRYYPSQAEANAAAINAGVDSFTVNDRDSGPTIAAITEARRRGLLDVAAIDDAVRHILTIRFRLGEFDPPGRNPYAAITPEVINAPAHQRLARRAAAAQMVLLKNAGGTLPLSPRRTRGVAVVGPLADTVYTDWYSGTPPYRVTARQGIAERLGDAARVTGDEAADRIALRDAATGRYVAATGSTDSDPVRATGTAADPAAQFDVFDWGQGIVTLRNVANGKYLGYNWGRFLTRDAQPNGWFVQQQFALEPRDDGGYALRYAGYETKESWFGPNRYVTVDADGALTLGAATAATAARFDRETISSGTASAVAAARAADVAVVMVGSMPFINGREAHDRTSTALAEGQAALVRAVRAANPNTVVVLQNSYPTTINWEQEHVPAILWTSHAGQETGHALADVLFGDHNPSGRLTQTWYRSDTGLPSILDYDIARTGMTYLYHRGRPLYPFGHGLSYSRFRYGDVRLDRAAVDAAGTVTVSVDVTNIGERAGTETVQLYTHQRSSRVQQPVMQLRGFERVRLAPGGTRTVRLSLRAADLAFWDVTRERRVVENASHDVLIGASAADIRGRASLRVRGETIPPRDLSAAPVAAMNFDDYSGVTLVDTTKAAGTAVAATAAGQWIEFADVAFPPDTTAISARVATPGDSPARIELRLGHPTRGRSIGTIAVPATGDRYAWTTVSADLRRAAGRHDLYLVFTGAARLDTVRLTTG